MKSLPLFKLATRTFKTRPGRTALTILGISIGIGAILFFVSLGYGLQQMLFKQIATSESLLTLDVATPNPGLVSLDKEIIDKISQIKDVQEIAPCAANPGQVIFGNLTSDVTVYACSPSYLELGGFSLSAGNFFNKDDEQKVILSTALLKIFNLKLSQSLGKEMNFSLFLPKQDEGGKDPVATQEVKQFKVNSPYKVTGVIEDDADSFVYLPLGTLKDLNIQQYSNIKVKVANTQAIQQIRDQIWNMGLLVSTLSETVDEINKIFNVIKIVLAIFGLVALFVAAIGLLNTMTVALLEKTNDIGVMKVLGGEDKDIERMFLIEATLMGLLGGIGGIILSKLTKFLFNGVLNLLAKGLGGQAVDIFYTPLWLTIFIIVFSAFIGALGGYFPAKRAAGLSPLDALRYK